MNLNYFPKNAICADCNKKLTKDNAMGRLLSIKYDFPGGPEDHQVVELICIDCYLTHPHPSVKHEYDS